MTGREGIAKELTLDEVYLQNRKILDSRKKRESEIFSQRIKKESRAKNFIRRFGRECMALFFE